MLTTPEWAEMKEAGGGWWMADWTRSNWLPVLPEDLDALIAERWQRAGLTSGRELVAAGSHRPPQPARPSPMVGEGGEARPWYSPGQDPDAPPVPLELPDCDVSWLGPLRAEHHELVDAWRHNAEVLASARGRFADEESRYREQLRAAVRADGDPEAVAPLTSPEVRDAQLDVLSGDERRARRELGRFVLRVLREEVPRRGDLFIVLAALNGVGCGPTPPQPVRWLADLATVMRRTSDEQSRVSRWMSAAEVSAE